MHSMLRGNPLGWPVAACGSVAGHLPGCLPAWTRLAVVHLVRFTVLRFGLFRFALVWLAHRRRPHYICRREDNNGHLVFGIRHWQLVTGNWQLATCSGVGRFYFYRYCLTIFPVGVAVGRSRAWVQSASPGCALSLLCGCSNHHHFCCCCCCCFVRYSLGDIFWVSASGKSTVKGQLAARRSQQTSAFCFLPGSWEIRVPAK